MLLALQYNRQPGDEALTRYLLDQEIQRHEQEPDQGLYENLDLATFLLGRFRRVADASSHSPGLGRCATDGIRAAGILSRRGRDAERLIDQRIAHRGKLSYGT